MASRLELLARKPVLRGVLHQWAAVAAFSAGIVLMAMAPNLRSALAGGIFALSLFTLFTVSATYHRPTWGPKGRVWMRRADHASIFILIAGTYTPICLLALPPESGRIVLIVAWSGALLGVLQSLFWINAPKAVAAILAVAVGWSLGPWLGDVWGALTTTQLVLILGGGIPYMLGAAAYALKRPNPFPGVFGYHELFHLCTLVSSTMHFAVVLMLVKNA